MKRMQKFIMRPDRFWMQRLCIVGMALLLFACSAARMGYNNGELVSYWWLDSYVDFENDQKPWVRQHIDTLFAWHRKTQLRDYVQVISHIQHRDLSTARPADLLNDYNEGKARILRIADHAAPELADLALSLTPAQIANVEQKFTRNNDKYRKEYLSGDTAERQKFRYRKMMKQAEYWFGNFDRDQETRLRALSDARPLNNDMLLAERLQRQHELLGLLRKIHAERPSRNEAAAMIRKYITDTVDRFGDSERQRFAEASNQANAALVAQMMRMATPEQRRHFVNTLQEWIGDFSRLSAQARS